MRTVRFTLKQARLLKGFTQREIASKLGVHVQTYSKMEKHPDEVTVREAKKLSDILEMSYDCIFFNQGSTLSRVNGDESTT
ncbi:helix-turn-helix domain-containing protein [Bacillus sp. J33]|uniref:helix-turn-helix domain-containing protein n=1 Tax=Bacillus sp. J33 TaxID=935836 RepID=UPI001E4E38AD|nr:helix-turn-helix transcriptional regulator [Bacillus sp. J33]